MSPYREPPSLPKVIFFDVFGTIYNWRSSVAKSLRETISRALSDPNKSISNELRETASALSSEDWLAFAEQWRKAYYRFTRNYDSTGTFISIDQHHYNSLIELLKKWGLEGLLTDEEVRELSFCWHKLEAWPDSVPGLEQLSQDFKTSTLSNGNMSLLEDLCRLNSPIPINDIASAEQFGAYKPSPLVYINAARRFLVRPQDCVLVAAHLGDLKAAKACGFHTIYVERPKEEAFTTEQIAKRKRDGSVDMWVDLGAGGFLEVARRLSEFRAELESGTVLS